MGKVVKDIALSMADSMADRQKAKASGEAHLLQSKHFGGGKPAQAPAQQRKGQPDGMVQFAEGKAKGMIGG